MMFSRIATVWDLALNPRATPRRGLPRLDDEDRTRERKHAQTWPMGAGRRDGARRPDRGLGGRRDRPTTAVIAEGLDNPPRRGRGPRRHRARRRGGARRPGAVPHGPRGRRAVPGPDRRRDDAEPGAQGQASPDAHPHRAALARRAGRRGGDRPARRGDRPQRRGAGDHRARGRPRPPRRPRRRRQPACTSSCSRRTGCSPATPPAP